MVAQSVHPDLISRALAFYGVKPAKIFPEQKGYRNRSFHIKTTDQQDLNLIIFKTEDGILKRIQQADSLSEIAHAHGLPVRHLYDPRILVLKSKSPQKTPISPHYTTPTPKSQAQSPKTTYARLYHYLPGTTIAWEMFSMNHIKLLGHAMSDLHTATKTADTELPSAAEELSWPLRHMARYFAKKGVQDAMLRKLKLHIVSRPQTNLHPTPPHDNTNAIFDRFNLAIAQATIRDPQPLHLDLVRGNLLFAPNKPRATTPWHLDSVALTGIIDFEKAALGSPLIDLARAYAFLLIDSTKPPEKIYKYLVESGYKKHGRNPLHIDPNLFQTLTDFFLVHDFYKFLEYNPYESLAQNHHFLRTRNILLAKNVLKLVP